MSALVFGLGNIVHKQYVKGLLFLAGEVGFILFMIFSGAHNLSMLPSLGWRKESTECQTRVHVRTERNRRPEMMLPEFENTALKFCRPTQSKRTRWLWSYAVNRILEQWGWINGPMPFFTDTTWARVTVIVINLWVGIPYTIMQVTGILQNIPAELYEAAKIDGANWWQIFVKITMPYIIFVLTPYR